MLNSATIAALAICGLWAVGDAWGQAWKAIDLSLRVETPVVQIGEIVYVDLYAVADNPEGGDEVFSMVTTPLTWNPAILQLHGVTCETVWPPDGYGQPCEEGGYEWMFTGFPDDSGMGGWNNTFDDGDCDYHAWPNYWGALPVATPEGCYVTSFIFEALAVGETTIEICDWFDQYTIAGVYDDEYGGWNIVDELDTLGIEVVPSDAALADAIGFGSESADNLLTDEVE
jgi:hypothetical protein